MMVNPQEWAALASAFAWPLTTLVLAFVFRPQILACVDRMQSLSVGGVKLDLQVFIEHSTDFLASLTIDRRRSLEAQTPLIHMVSSMATTKDKKRLYGQLESLAREYDLLRCSMPPGDERTNAMELVASRMRLLAPAALDRLDELTQSKSAGTRLVATTALAAFPRRNQVDWLLQRFDEDSGFIQFHAAIALRSASRVLRLDPETFLLRVRKIHSAIQNRDGATSDRAYVLGQIEEELGIRTPRSRAA